MLDPHRTRHTYEHMNIKETEMKMGENQDTSGVQHIVVERAWVLESEKS